eukprot:GHVR01180312.1.p2 GENE.GHVR01180312.1~~GHVR01180312.1.p2  ORF type:complete len:145 (+),score=55.04 GHVR01180312.1:69-503(+)
MWMNSGLVSMNAARVARSLQLKKKQVEYIRDTTDLHDDVARLLVKKEIERSSERLEDIMTTEIRRLFAIEVNSVILDPNEPRRIQAMTAGSMHALLDAFNGWLSAPLAVVEEQLVAGIRSDMQVQGIRNLVCTHTHTHTHLHLL